MVPYSPAAKQMAAVSGAKKNLKRHLAKAYSHQTSSKNTPDYSNSPFSSHPLLQETMKGGSIKQDELIIPNKNI